jgi:hypothetical protein
LTTFPKESRDSLLYFSEAGLQKQGPEVGARNGDSLLFPDAVSQKRDKPGIDQFIDTAGQEAYNNQKSV